MTWVRIDDKMPDHPKVAGLSLRAFKTHVSGICYCSRYLTDGIIPAGAAKTFSTKKVLRELLDADLWHEHPEGFEVNDYLDYNQSREQSQSESEVRRSRAKKAADARWHAPSNASSMLTSTDSAHADIDIDKDVLTNHEENGDDPVLRALLAVMGETVRSQAHLELLGFRAKGASEYDFRTVTTALEKARARNPRAYVRSAIANRLRERTPA